MFNRLDTYYSNGHVPDKLEIIIEGGTFTEYPPDYLEEYMRDLFYAANIYFDLREAFPEYDNIGEYCLDFANLEKIRQSYKLPIRNPCRFLLSARLRICMFTCRFVAVYPF